MPSYGRLPVTGLATLTIGGVLIDQTRLVAIAFVLVAVGALLVRLTWRRNKTVVSR